MKSTPVSVPLALLPLKWRAKPLWGRSGLSVPGFLEETSSRSGVCRCSLSLDLPTKSWPELSSSLQINHWDEIIPFFPPFLHYVIEACGKGSRTANFVSIKNVSGFFCSVIYFSFHVGEHLWLCPAVTAAQPEPLQPPFFSICWKWGDQCSPSILSCVFLPCKPQSLFSLSQECCSHGLSLPCPKSLKKGNG